MPCFLKSGPQTSSISIHLELVRNAESQVPPPDLNHILHINKILRSGEIFSNVVAPLLSPSPSAPTFLSFFILSPSLFNLDPTVLYLNNTLTDTVDSLVPLSLKH